MAEHVIKIENGSMEFVHADELIPLEREGDTIIRRVSHVEPASTYCGSCNRSFDVCRCLAPRVPVAAQGWVADMSPLHGPLLGTYLTRQEALDAERAWLREHKGL